MLFFICNNQKCQIKWAGASSNSFSVSNGVRQGAVSSAILVAIYIDDLLERLRKSRLGCYIDSVFVGAFIFADGILLLSANRSGLQSLVNICQQFASERNLKFGTNTDPSKSKTKCMVFSKKRSSVDPAPITLDGKNLPWVKKINHLGNILECDNSMKTDIIQKRGQFIGRVNSLFQEFHYTSPEIMFQLVNTYASSFYGSQLWNLRSNEAEKLFNSWNVTVRNILDLNRRTHRCLIEPLSNRPHLKTLLLSRLVSFFKGLISSKKFTVRFLARMAENDCRTVLGSTLAYLKEQCTLKKSQTDSLTSMVVRKNLVYQHIPPESSWKSDLAIELLRVRTNEIDVNGFSNYELEEILTYACTA